MKISDLKAKDVIRELVLEVRAIDEERREVDLAFSSETPVNRYWGIEILDHSPGAVRMDRMRNGLAVLINHDRDQQVGVTVSATIDADKTGRAKARFSRSAFAEEIFRDVVDGIRRLVSVAYRIHDAVEEGKQDGMPVIRITDWEPLEVSIVAVPADASVGVGRAHTDEVNLMSTEKPAAVTHDEPQKKADRKADEQTITTKTEAEVRSIEKDLSRAREDDQIRSVGKHFGFDKLAEDYITLGRSLEEFRGAVFEAKKADLKPVPVESEDRGNVIQIPRRRGVMRAFANTREGEEAAYRAGMWALATIYGDARALRWCKDYGVRVMTGTSSTTSAVVPDEMVLPIIDLREQYGVARRYCYSYPMGSDTATVPRRTSGVTAYFPDRTTATTASDMAFDDVNLVAREVAALTRLARSYVADAAIDLGDTLAREMAYAFAVKEDDCLFNGDGTSTYGGIYGIRPKIIDGNHTAGAVSATANTDTFAEVAHDDLISTAGALPYYAGIMPRWYISKRGNALVFDALKTAGGGNTITDISGRVPPQYLGDEVVISQAMPTTTGDLSSVVMIVYGDLMLGTVFGDRAGIEIEVLRERYAEFRQIGIQAVERFDIVVHGLGDTSNAGPIVALVGN